MSVILAFLLCFFSPFLWAQSEDVAAPGAAGNAENAPGTELPASYRGFSLGMEAEDLKGALQKDALFNFRGDRDISFLPNREQSLIETTGFSFVRRAFFQLRDGKLFVMAFNLDTGLVDHYSVYTSFVKKYGEPVSLNPQEAVWESRAVRISIERPLTVKYIDKEVFADVIAESETGTSSELYLRQEFLDDF
ncbi:MAG: hypothetical protein LBT16_08545 [Treponema sp.]|jgi:hypothetical protein|nr:hypothetical protein [Treponema sp.]